MYAEPLSEMSNRLLQSVADWCYW